MVNQNNNNNNNNNNRRRNNRNRNNRRGRQAKSRPSLYTAAKATSSSCVQVRGLVSPSPSPSYSSSSSNGIDHDGDDDFDCRHESCIKHCYPCGHTTHANWRCYRFTNPKRFEGILRKRGYYNAHDQHNNETHRSSGDSASPDVVTNGHAQQRGTCHDAHDDADHPQKRVQQTVVNHNNDSSSNRHLILDELKIKDTLYLFNKNNVGQKNQWGLVPEEDVVRNRKKMNDPAPSPGPLADVSKNKKAEARRRQRAACRKRTRQASQNQGNVSPKNQRDNNNLSSPPSGSESPQGTYCGPMFGYPGYDTWSIIIKDVEYIGLLQVGRPESLLSTRVAKELGLRVVDVVKPNMQQRAKGGRRPASSSSSSSSTVRTAALLPIHIPRRGSSKFMLSLEVGDVEHYDLLVGDDIFAHGFRYHG